MRTWNGLVLFVIVLFASQLVAANGPVPPRAWIEGQYRLGFVPEASTSYVVLHTPSIIALPDLERYSAVLALSDDQYAHVLNLHRRYVERDWELRIALLQPLYRQTAVFTGEEWDDDSRSVERARGIQMLRKERDRVMPRLRSVEQQFLAELEVILSDDQLDELAQVRAHRSRVRSRIALTTFPGTMLDLTDMLYELDLERFDVTPKDQARFQFLIAEYDLKVTPLLERYCRAYLRKITEGGLIRAQQEELGLAISMGSEKARAIYSELDEERRSNNRALVVACRRIHDTNRRLIHLVAAELMDPDSGDALVEAFNRSVYKPIYPDPFDITPLFEWVLARKTLATEQSRDVADLHASYQSVRGQLAARMEHCYLQWKEHFETTFSMGGPEFDSYQREMQQFQEARRANAATMLMGLQSVFAGNELAVVLAESRQYESALLSAESLKGSRWPTVGD